MAGWKDQRLLPGTRQPKLVGQDGGLCATFVNTASDKRRRLETYAELLEWGQVNGVLASDDAERLAREAAERPADAAAVVSRSAELRASIERILRSLAERKKPAATDLAALNAALDALPHPRLEPEAADGYRWTWSDRGGDDLDRMLWPVVCSAADVLVSRNRHKVRECEGEDCDLLFVDRTAGQPRKWCSMKTCGTRARSRRHYYRKVKPIHQWIRDGIEAERTGREKPQRLSYPSLTPPPRRRN